ncbi:MAG: Uric acid transporter UacT [Burkholderia gladioli]|nr:MAG: Uric acid transporter UacT [Burkholderia gladioli]
MKPRRPNLQLRMGHRPGEILPAGKLVTLGLQHVLVMYAGAVAVPLIIGSALKLPKDQGAFLISADLFACGIVIAPVIGKLLRFFPPVVVGTVIAAIGLSLMGVGINWAAGGVRRGQPGIRQPAVPRPVADGAGADPADNKLGRGFVANIAVLLGIVAGFAIALALGRVDLDGVTVAPWVGFVMPFHFGVPHFDTLSIATMVIVMFVTFIESTGMFLAVGDMVDRPVDQQALVRGLRVDGLSTLIGGIFNSFPHTSFSQNVGLVGVTGVKSRFVCVTGGVILVLLGLFPKMAQIIASVPAFVLGGAGIVMFGMVAANGVKTLSRVDFVGNHNNLTCSSSPSASGWASCRWCRRTSSRSCRARSRRSCTAASCSPRYRPW